MCTLLKAEVSLRALSCGGGGLRIILCPDRKVNTDQRLRLNRLTRYHVYIHHYQGVRDYILYSMKGLQLVGI